MRVISGDAARRKLQSPPGNDIRPTTDRIKETLFNILAPDIYGADFLDLFTGSGQIGIEALSRGAASCVFVDEGKTAIDCTKKNVEVLNGLDVKYDILRMNAASAVSKLYNQGKRFDIIFMDPPYDKELEKEVLLMIDRYPILKDDGYIIVEASAETEFDYLEDMALKITREKKYGSNKHIFIAKK